LNILKRSKMNILVVVITIMITVTILYFNVFRFYGYKVSIGENTITFVRNKSEFNKTYKELQRDIKLKYSNVIVVNDFTFNKVKVDDAGMFIGGNDLKKVMLKKFNIGIDAFVMKSDNIKIAYVTNENQGKEILKSIKNHYYKVAKLGSVSAVDIQNKISYESAKVRTGELYENSQIVNDIIKYNDKSQTPLIAVKIVGNKVENKIIYPTTVMKSSSEIMNGVNKTISKGINGLKKVSTQITSINSNIVNEKMITSENIKQVQNKEIYVGTKKPTLLVEASINSPSRGSISSPFGTRWGKMHKGVDIAASFGSTINAALDGTISYAGWESGYGNVIKIDHGKALETTYAHCSVITAKIGEVVKKGTKIGEVGSTGNSTGPHLHFEVRENGVPKDPLLYIK
jgi:murein DD-endopeptidase MepM/ murein hydrolase activator NlpD